ncbi:hypothetical protein A2U01_0030470 [Trifolium medium]|uniref:Uncharacterized protein n=1 Tax=Trifolium medium TaxID=97028 RepID=A0A392PC68_9FABA|nr:hypothetical protein [Trifolium medium]
MLFRRIITDLETTEAKLADVVKERDGLLVRVKELEEKISRLEEKLKSSEVTLIGEEEKKADPGGIYVESSRAELIAKIFEVESNMIETSTSQFHNAIAQLRVLNPGVELKMEGLDEEKEVCGGQIVTPPDEEEEN